MTGRAPKVSLYQAILGVQGVSRWALAKKVLKETPYAIARALRALIIQTLLVCLCSEFAWQWQGSCFWRAICITSSGGRSWWSGGSWHFRASTAKRQERSAVWIRHQPFHVLGTCRTGPRNCLVSHLSRAARHIDRRPRSWAHVAALISLPLLSTSSHSLC